MRGPAVLLRQGFAAASVAVALSGCAASVTELRHHSQQERLERLLAEILPHTKYVQKHYWVRVSEPMKQRVGLTVLPHRHIYLSADLLDEADDRIVTALLAHGVAHHRLHHHTRRGAARVLSQAAFKVGGFFVPGLGHGHHVGDPIAEAAFSAGQEQAADKKAAAYLTRMGRTTQDLADALAFLKDAGYGECVGRLRISSREFESRLRTLAHLQASGPSEDDTP